MLAGYRRRLDYCLIRRLPFFTDELFSEHVPGIRQLQLLYPAPLR
jgi:hypothetical protein